jgi:hypothetical protein
LLRFDRRADDQQELARIGSYKNELAAAPANEDGTIRADTDRADIDRAYLAIGCRHVDPDKSSVNLGLPSDVAAKIDLHATGQQYGCIKTSKKFRGPPPLFLDREKNIQVPDSQADCRGQ